MKCSHEIHEMNQLEIIQSVRKMLRATLYSFMSPDIPCSSFSVKSEHGENLSRVLFCDRTDPPREIKWKSTREESGNTSVEFQDKRALRICTELVKQLRTEGSIDHHGKFCVLNLNPSLGSKYPLTVINDVSV